MSMRVGCSSTQPLAVCVSQLTDRLARQITDLQAERQIILDHCQVPILFVSGKDKRVREVNAAAARLFVRPEKALVGSFFDDLVHRESTRGDSRTHGVGHLEAVTLQFSGTKVTMTRVSVPNQAHPIWDLVLLTPHASAVPLSAGTHKSVTIVDNDDDVGSIGSNIIGKSEAIRNVCRLIGKVAKSDSTVLIQGESGTGKELCAKAIHLLSNRRGRAFVGVNCAALSESLLESELFGHVKGAFTGAIRDRDGRFRQANKGTILLDEIGTMPLSAQSRLLRVLQERQFEAVGSSKPIDVDVRVIATTNVNLEEAVAERTFREDLFYRLNVIAIDIPPLRYRRDDIPLLANEFIKKYGRKFGKIIRGVSPEALELLLNHVWPGNVRQLENTLERATVLEESEIIQPASLGLTDDCVAVPEPYAHCGELGLRRQLEILERHIVLHTLRRVNWIRKSAARQLGINPKNFNYFLKKHNISARESSADASAEVPH